MLDHVSIGSSDLVRAARFYDAVLASLGYVRLHLDESSLGYGDSRIAFWVGVAQHPVPADSNSGLHFCFIAPSRASVDAFHAAALSNGGKDNGKPGLRSDYGPDYYAAFVIDPDGYRIEAYCGAKA